MKTCPKCMQQKDDDAFGKRKIRGQVKPQSWCKVCRGKPNPNRKPKGEPKPKSKTEAKRLAVQKAPEDDRAKVAALYAQHYPGDKAGPKRSRAFMAKKLNRKLGLSL